MYLYFIWKVLVTVYYLSSLVSLLLLLIDSISLFFLIWDYSEEELLDYINMSK